MNKPKTCIICHGENTETLNASFADFITDRVFDNHEHAVNLIHCNDCEFAYYDYRFNDEECGKLYAGYRNEEYQKQREKHECWYTKEINDLIGKNDAEVKNRNKNLIELLKKHTDISQIKSILDFGGDKGQFIPDVFTDAKKYVYEISGVETITGVQSIDTFEDCAKNDYNLIICAHVLEHVADPTSVIKQIKSLMKKGQYLYVELPFDSPLHKKKTSNLGFLFNKYFSWMNILKHFLKSKRKKKSYQAHEHINHFTPKSIEVLLKKEGFKILHNDVKTIDCEWVKSEIISTLCIFD